MFKTIKLWMDDSKDQENQRNSMKLINKISITLNNISYSKDSTQMPIGNKSAITIDPVTRLHRLHLSWDMELEITGKRVVMSWYVKVQERLVCYKQYLI